MSGENVEEEERPVSIASLRSRFEGLAASNAPVKIRSYGRDQGSSAEGQKNEEALVSKTDLVLQGKVRNGGEESAADEDESTKAPTASLSNVPDPSPAAAAPIERTPKPRLKPSVAPKPPSLASRPSSPVVPTASSNHGRNDSRVDISSSTNASSPSEQHSTPQAEEEAAPSVKSLLARFGNQQPPQNAVAGPSRSINQNPPLPTSKSEIVPPPPTSRPPSIRRTSANGHNVTAIPSSPPSDQIEKGPPVSALPRASSPIPSRSKSPPTPIFSGTPSAILRAPSPKPPEPNRASKPTFGYTPRSGSPVDPEEPLLSDTSASVPPPQSISSLSAGPPPIPPNRPRLASVASAVIAAQAIAAPPRLPARNRGESVGTRDLPPPPARSSTTRSATVIPSLPARPAPSPAKNPILESPSETYTPPLPPTRTTNLRSTPSIRRQGQDLRPPETTLDPDSEDDPDENDEPTSIPGLTSAAKRALEDSPDSTHANRRPPNFNPDVKISTTAHVTSFAAFGRFVCVGSHVIRVYDTQLSDQPIHYVDLHHTGLEFRVKDPKVTSMCFRPAVNTSDEGRYLWCGTRDGHLLELDIKTGEISDTRPAAHSSSIVNIFRYKDNLISLDEGGKLLVFAVKSDAGIELVRTLRVSERFNFAKLICGRLWTSTGPSSRSTTSAAAAKGPTIRIYEPCSATSGGGGKTVWATEWTGAVTCATIIPLDPNTVYLGHEGGYVSIWDSEEVVCRQVLKISSSDILCLEGVGERLWAGNRKGQIHAYDVSTRPWRATNLWTAHPDHSVHQLLVDPWSIEQTGRFTLWSLGKDALRAWDGLLSVDWIDSRMTARQADYSHFRDIKTLVCSWNIDSARPTDLAGSEANINFLPELLHSVDQPEIIVFGFQEVIPLTDKKLTAKTLLFGSKHRDSNATADKVSGAYRQWLDKLTMAVRMAYPDNQYVKIHSESLVGLYTCVFVKASEREYLRDLDVTVVKRGIGGIYGNKGAIIARLVIDDTSICFINVHLAAGQSAKAARTVDLGVIMEDKAILPMTDRLPFINGGDGTAVLDHELVILNGDLNYRIDQRRENVLSSIQAGELQYLLEHDQLRKEMQSNHAFRLRSFEEVPITFKPTYKYNTGTSDYDSSDKRRIPAWCDRILFNKTPRLQSLHYRRYETTVSDHKPISAAFRMQIKAVDEDRMEIVRREVGKEWAKREGEMLGLMENAYLELV